MNKQLLVIAAHPDDEVLGCGGIIASLYKEGFDVHIVFLADGIHSRHTILFFEVPSSTEWQTPGSDVVFSPNWFVDITNYLDVKNQALEAYAHEMRPWPHSRSIKAVEHLARWRGASVGVEAAEAFILGRQITIEK